MTELPSPVVPLLRAEADKKRATLKWSKRRDYAEHRRLVDGRRTFSDAERDGLQAAHAQIIEAHERGRRARGALFRAKHPKEAARIADRLRGEVERTLQRLAETAPTEGRPR